MPEKMIIDPMLLGFVQNKALGSEAIRERNQSFRIVDTRLSDHQGIPRTKLEMECY